MKKPRDDVCRSGSSKGVINPSLRHLIDMLDRAEEKCVKEQAEANNDQKGEGR